MRNNADKISMRRLRPSPAMVISLFALLVAMSTGAYAVTIAPPNSVNSKSIKTRHRTYGQSAGFALRAGYYGCSFERTHL